jgi:hypothetical protein
MPGAFPARHQRGDSGALNLFLYGAAGLGLIAPPSAEAIVVDVGAAYGMEALVGLEMGYTCAQPNPRAPAPPPRPMPSPTRAAW